MRPPRRATRRMGDLNALSPRSTLSPPSDSSASTEMADLRIQPVSNGNLTTREVQLFYENHPICLRVPFFVTRSRRPIPVEDVAKKLVGHFLISRQSNVVLQIVETEAYPEHEQIYRNRFPGPPPEFRGPPGRLVSCTLAFGQQLMFITAGADASRDLVLLRTCTVVHGRDEIADRVNLAPPYAPYDLRNMISGPTKVSMVLAPELMSPFNLVTPSRGLNLLQKDPGNPLIMLDGPRLLPRDTANKRYTEMPGANSRFRFAFVCDQSLELRRNLRRAPVNQPQTVDPAT